MEPHDDPFARAPPPGVGQIEVTGPIGGRLAARDPDAPLDDSAEFRPAGAASFDDLLRHARLKGFLAGAAVGALGAAAISVVLALATSRPVATTTTRAIEPRPEAPAPAQPPPDAAGATARPAATPRRAAEGAAPRRAASAAHVPAPDDLPVPGASVPEAELPVPARGSAVGLDITPSATPGAAAEPDEAASAPGADDAASAAPESSAPEIAAAAAPSHEPGRGRGPFPARDVAEALRSRGAALADCVATMPGAAAAARGQRFALTVVIDPSGRVSDVQIDDPEIETTPLGVCLLRLAHGMSFAPFEGAPFRVELALGYGDAD